MTSSLYNEALSDARAIREAAEERAKQQLLESMSPRLKKIVESTINKEMGLSDELDESEDDQFEGQMNNSSQKIKMGEVQSIDLDEDDEDDVDECGGAMYESDEFKVSMSQTTKCMNQMIYMKKKMNMILK